MRLSFLASACLFAMVSIWTPQARADDPAGGPPIPLLVGNYHALMPGGIAFIQNDAFGIVLDVGWDKTWKPGSAAPDFSIMHIVFERDGANVTFDWGWPGGRTVMGRLKTDKPVKFGLRIPQRPWHSFNQVCTGVKDGVDAVVIAGDGRQIAWLARFTPGVANCTARMDPEATIEVSIAPDRPVVFAAGFGELPALNGVDAWLNAATAKYNKQRARAEGAWGDFAGAIADNLNNSRLYSTNSKRVMSVIGRTDWIIVDKDPDYLPYFAWDTCFNALLIALEDPQQARTNIRTLLNYQTPEGMVPQISNWSRGHPPFVSIDKSNPPVGAMCAWKIYQRWPDKAFLAEVYPKLVRWHDWWGKFSDGNKNGLPEWGSATGSFYDARLACGWDDTPQYDGCKMIGTQMSCDAVDLSALWSMDAEYLAKMAAELGRPEEAKRLQEEHAAINRRINDLLWNEELGAYCSRLWDEEGKPGKHLTRLTPMNLYPLICGAPEGKRAERVVAMLTDPKKFWGQWLIPTLPYDDPDWPKQHYWLGHVWPPANYLVWLGVQRYCDGAQQAYFAQRSVDLFMRNWTAKGTCNENFRSVDGRGGGIAHYTWGALLCQIGLEAICDVGPDGKPLARASVKEPIELRNMPAGGKLYRISVKDGQATIQPEE